MVYLYDACDQISDFCHQQLLRKMRRKISWTDRGKTVYPPPPLGSGGITRKNCFRYLKLISPLNAAICTTTSKDKNVMARTRKYYLKKHDLTLRSKVITVRDTLPYGHAPTYQISLTYLERQKCYGPDKKILFKKILFDLEVKGHYGMRHTALWSCTHIPNIIDLS